MLRKTFRRLLGDLNQLEQTISSDSYKHPDSKHLDAIFLLNFYLLLKIRLLKYPHLACWFLQDIYYNPSFLSKEKRS